MSQCQARTSAGTRCQRSLAIHSKTVCKAHLNQLQRGGAVRLAATGRRLPAQRST